MVTETFDQIAEEVILFNFRKNVQFFFKKIAGYNHGYNGHPINHYGNYGNGHYGKNYGNYGHGHYGKNYGNYGHGHGGHGHGGHGGRGGKYNQKGYY
jgi:hypothetical protein